ncbi:MAG: EAL domain-containing protein [Zoogloea sp.]|nr:EAL domain-containing protein [Zoogloea sp.]
MAHREYTARRPTCPESASGGLWLAAVAPAGEASSLAATQDTHWLLWALVMLGVVGLISALVLRVRTLSVERQVEEQTRALAEANDSLGNYQRALAETNRLLESEIVGHNQSIALLQETSSLKDAILESAEYAIVYTDSQGFIHTLNPAAARMLGWPAEELVGKETPLVYHSQEDVARWSAQHHAEGFAAIAAETRAHQGSTHEIILRRRDGSTFPASVAMSTVVDHSGEIRGYLSIVQDITQRRATESRILQLAHYDSLTTLPNRTLLKQRLDDAIRNAASEDRKVAVLFIDLDRFKYVNDSLGHQVGDELLQAVSRRFSTCVRERDTVARMGGDEFVVVLTGLETPEISAEVAERILASLQHPVVVGGHPLTISPSIGISLYPDDGGDGDTLIKHADVAMYLAKERGRNNFQYFESNLSARYSERLDLENRLREAVEHMRFELAYQPQVDTMTGELIGIEALVRWRDIDGRLIPPDHFIPVAEDSGLIVPIGEWVLNEACRQSAAWQARGLALVPIAVNLSARQFEHADLLDSIRSALAESGLAPASLDLELTESLVMGNPERTREILKACKELGLMISVDDFGTGYSSLAYLKRFPIDRLKIDRSFIKDIVDQPDDAAIARTIVAMAHTLRITVIAEGVETESQLGLLRRWGCDAYQGYLCSRPLDGEAMSALLEGMRAAGHTTLAHQPS